VIFFYIPYEFGNWKGIYGKIKHKDLTQHINASLSDDNKLEKSLKEILLKIMTNDIPARSTPEQVAQETKKILKDFNEY